jgi:predicted nucleic acid-binding Zn ribbon protein
VSDPEHVRRGLELFLKHLGAPPVNVITELSDRWVDVVGPALADATRPVELVDGVLAVSCDDPAWAAQVRWMEQQIIDRFTALFPDLTLSRVTTKTM